MCIGAVGEDGATPRCRATQRVRPIAGAAASVAGGIDNLRALSRSWASCPRAPTSTGRPPSSTVPDVWRDSAVVHAQRRRRRRAALNVSVEVSRVHSANARRLRRAYTDKVLFCGPKDKEKI